MDEEVDEGVRSIEGQIVPGIGDTVLTALGNGSIFNLLCFDDLPSSPGDHHWFLTQDDSTTNTNAYAGLLRCSQCRMETVIHN